MAENKISTLLGFVDELITENYHSLVNFATNKIGGKPDLPANVKLDPPQCPLCRLPRLLVLQIYAPIETTTFHRTLYLFACINPNCWNQNASWICLRSQTLDQIPSLPISDEHETQQNVKQQTSTTLSTNATDWCADADDWLDDDVNANLNEENGNLIGANKLAGSDEDEESCSLEESVLRAGMELLYVTDERNANNGGDAQEVCGAGAMGCLHSPCARAEIEGGEGDDVISIDSPTRPLTDISSLLRQTAPLPNVDINYQQFRPYFICVTEETANQNYQIIPDRHIRDLLQVYNQQTTPDEAAGPSPSPHHQHHATSTADLTPEKYEESIPAHGDKMFHYFLTKVQQNPGQIMRYARGSTTPLLLYPLQQMAPVCKHCAGVLVFEFQVLPTLIQRLHLQGDVVMVGDGQQNASAMVVDDEDSETRLEWGNVLVYTCRKSCWGGDVDFREEYVVVQKELY